MYAALWFGVILGVQVQLVDSDGPGLFRTEAACIAHVRAVTPKMIAIIRAQFKMPDDAEVFIAGMCPRQSDRPRLKL